MGILSFLGIGTRGTPRTAEQLVPAVDLANGTVCELGRDDTRTTVEQRLGPPTSVVKAGIQYEQIGLHVGVATLGTMGSWSILVTPEILPLWRGLPATEAHVVALFGEPTKRETDDEELMLHWELARMYVLVDFGLDGRLHDVFIDFT